MGNTQRSDPFVSIALGIAASLLVYWTGVWVLQEISAENLMPYARYLGWTACSIGTLITAHSLGEEMERAVLFAITAFVIAIPLSLMGESVTHLRVLTFAVRVEAVMGTKVDIAARNHDFAFHLLPGIFGGSTILMSCGYGHVPREA